MRGVLCLLVGLLMAAGSSVAAVLVPDTGRGSVRAASRHDLPDGTTIYAFDLRRGGVPVLSVTGPMERAVADALDRIRSQTIETMPGDPRPWWLRRTTMDQPQTVRGVAAGWPVPCFWGRTERNVNHRPQEVHTGLVHVSVGRAVRAFPWRPLWPGLAANTAAYALAGLALWLGVDACRRWWRRRRGRCPRCGYPQPSGASRCPECGQALNGLPEAAG